MYDSIAIFCLLVCGNLSRKTYNRMKKVLSHRLSLSSYHLLLDEISKLSFVQDEAYDCCINSCCAYTGDNEPFQECPHCKEPRFNESGRARQQFRYLPLAPRLQSLFLNKKLATFMDYRNDYNLESSDVSDVFDGEHYRTLLSRRVVIDNVPQGHSFFSERRDVALGFMTDGFQIFKKPRGGSATCWPMIAINFNLPPEMRIHLPHILPLGIIPGPKAPTDFDSFEYPFVAECKRLAAGVQTLDARLDEVFSLHVYPISCHGDMPAIKHCMCFKGHNAICPCRTCEIRGVRDTTKARSPYYVPLQPPESEASGWDPSRLPLRTEARVEAQLSAIQSARTATARNKLKLMYGINKQSILVEIPSLSIVSSFPHEWMHLLLENHAKNLLDFWQGKYKDLDEGRESYRIPDKTWEVIGEETAQASKTIPVAFARPTPNIWTERRFFSAEDYSFWFIHLAPHVLKDRFARPKYYKHFMKFNKILRMTLQFSFNPEDLATLRQLIIEYVDEYEL